MKLSESQGKIVHDRTEALVVTMYPFGALWLLVDNGLRTCESMALERPDHRVLVVEDDASLASMIVDYLSDFEFDVSIHATGADAAKRILNESPDAVLLDVNLPGNDGYSICKAIRQEYDGIVMMISGRIEELDEILGLEAGADDYISKPLRPRALLARLRMHLRRVPSSHNDKMIQPIEVDSLTVSPASRSVRLYGNVIELTTSEFDLLWLLASHTGKTVKRKDLYPQLFGLEYDGRDRSIDLRVSRLRRKLGDDPDNPRIIKSVRGIGYILVSPLNGNREHPPGLPRG